MIFTISNFMSFARILIAFPLGYMIYINDIFWIITLTLIGLLTDFLDGFLARKFDQVSELGRILDPLADKIIIGMSGAVLIYTGKLPLWFGLMIIIRDILILMGATYMKKKNGQAPSANYIGKIAVNIISLAILLIIFEVEEWIKFGIHLATAAILISFTSYVFVLLKEIRSNGNIR